MTSLSSSLRALTKAQAIRGIHISQFTPSLRIRTIYPSIPFSTRQYSTAGFGDQGGSPMSEHPQNQGFRPRSDTEHPGPEPVAEGKGTSGVKGKAEGTWGERSPEAVTATESEGRGDSVPRGGVPGSHPTMSARGEQAENGQVDDEVRRHNEEMRKRYGHQKEGEEDEKVDPKFWTGMGGRDREP